MAAADGYVKRFKAVSVIGLVNFLVTVTVNENASELQALVPEVERLFLASALLRAQVPTNASVDSMEDEFATSMQDQWGNFSSSGAVPQLIASWDEENYSFGGYIRLSTGEQIRFTRKPGKERPSALAEPQDEFDILYQYYDVFRAPEDKHHELILASGFVQRGSLNDFLKAGWVLVERSSGDALMATDIDSTIIRLTGKWVNTSSGAESAYLSLRSLQEQQTVRVPVVGIDVSATNAFTFLAMVSLTVAALVCHSLLFVRSQLQAVEEPWIVLVRGKSNSTLAKVTNALFYVGGGLTYTISILLPPIAVWLCISHATSLTVSILTWVVFAVVVWFAVVSVTAFLSILHPADAND